MNNFITVLFSRLSPGSLWVAEDKRQEETSAELCQLWDVKRLLLTHTHKNTAEQSADWWMVLSVYIPAPRSVTLTLCRTLPSF